MRDRCPTPETLGTWAEGRLAEADRRTLLDHAADCPSCRRQMAVARLPEIRTAPAAPRLGPRLLALWLILAAALAVMSVWAAR